MLLDKPNASPTRRLESVQVFRGLAAVAVLLFHVQLIAEKRLGVSFLDGFWTEGRGGVDFFFVLSGFIITWVHRSDFENPTAIRPYWIKRLVRIYPLAVVLTVGKLGAMLAAPQLIGEHQLDFSFVVSSLLLLPQETVPILPPAWTLSHELLFYGAFLVALVFGRKIWQQFCTAWFIGICCMGLMLTQVADETEIKLLPRFLFHPHNLQFLMGCGLAWLYESGRWRRQHAMVLLIAGLVIGAFKIATMWDEHGSLRACLSWGLAFSLIIAAGIAWESEGESQTSHWPRWLKILGDASYSVYLINTPLIVVGCVVLGKLGFVSGWPVQVGLIAIAIISTLIGLVCYRLLEKPMTRWLRNRCL